MKRHFFLFCCLSALVLLCCFPAYASALEKVEHAGALRNFMHEGDISPKINLQNLAGRKHLYALGAAGNLKGEIMILDSRPLVSKVVDGKVIHDSSFDHTASLLVFTQVNKWDQTVLPDTGITYQQLEAYIENAAEKAGLDPGTPFPFMIKGVARSANWHVINWAENDPVHTHEKHKIAGVHGTLSNEKVVILGFFSKHHTGIFNHHSTNMHLHLQSGKSIAGHVDDLVLTGKNSLLLPASE